MASWRNWDWQAIAIIVTIIGAAYLLGRDTVSPGEVRAIVTDAVGTAVAEAARPLATRDEVRAIATDAVGTAVAEAVRPLATRDEVRAIATDAVGAAVAEAVRPLATRDEVRAIATDAVGAAVAEAVRPLATRDAIDSLHDGQRAQSNCLSDLYIYMRGRPSFASDVPACDRLAESGQ